MKKIFIVSAVFIVITAGVILFLLFNNRKSLETGKDIEKIESLVPAKPGERNIDTAEWERRSAENIELSLPPGWKAQKFKANENGYAIEITPEGKGVDDAFPRIDIMVLPYESEEQIEDLAYQVESFGFKRSSASFLGINAIKLSTVLKGFAFAQGNPEKKDVIKDLFIFRKGSNVYQIDYAYYVDQDRNKTEETIRGIFSTLIIN